MLPKIDELTSDQRSIIVQKIREWCSCHGLLMRSPHHGPVFYHLSVTLLPTAIPKILFDQAMQMQSDFHQLFDVIARNYDFLDQHLKR